MISKLYDRTHFQFIQFTETLSYLDTYERYAQLLPAQVERVLSVDYNLPPAYTMFIIRGSLKPIYLLNGEEEFGKMVHLFKSILDMHLDQRHKGITDEKFEENEYFDERSFIMSRKDEVWTSLNPKLYTIFWYMTL